MMNEIVLKNVHTWVRRNETEFIKRSKEKESDGTQVRGREGEG